MGPVIVIGGGAVGLSVAYHLAQRGVDEILLLERNQLTSGTSWHAAGIVGPLRATANMTRLAMYATQLFPRLETETGMSTGYRRTGGYWLARQHERLDELHRIAALGRHFDMAAEMVTAQTVNAAMPCLDLSNHVGALAVAEDANVNPVDLCMAYARAAKRGGVEIREGVEVSEIVAPEGRVCGVRLADGSVIKSVNVVLCCGAWSKPLADSAGLALPLQPVEHMYVVTEPIADLPEPFPVIRDLDTGIYIKGDAGGKLVIGGFEPNAKCWNAFGPESDRAFLELPEDWDQFAPFMEAALDLVPALDKTGIQHFMNGPESFTMDTRPLIGEAPAVDGLFVAAGMNSVGVMSSAGVGRVLADWVVDGCAPMDLWEVDVARADPAAASDAHMRDRMQEAVSDVFSMHWPFKQPSAGRDLRRSCLHEKWAAQGAVFGMTAGWERGLWYAHDVGERDLPYSIGEQPWQSIAEREAAVMADGVCMMDLSAFGKFDITGRDALAFVDQLACARMDVDEGQAMYTPILNEKGGIEADVTITRLDETHFRMTSGAATRWRDSALLRRGSAGFSVSIDDVTEDEAVIGVMGAQARSLLASLSEDDWSDFPFSTCRLVTVAGTGLRATRMSFVGELGWELNIAAERVASVFDALIDAGANPMGHYALDGCRIEKGFRHWGHDLGPGVSPLEAGLGFTIDWDKEFRGRAALVQQREQGLTSRLCLFDVDGDPLVLHDEPIREAGKIVGLTTSGARGARTGLTLALGLIDIGVDEKPVQTCERSFEIEIAGTLHPARVLRRPPFDPNGDRMRA